jgi:SEFIR domain protein
MEKQKVPYPPLAISTIAGIMASKDACAPNYLKGPELVNIFQSLGFPDSYTFAEGKGIQTLDFGEGLSRLAYTTKRLATVNESLQMPIAIQKFIEKVHDSQKALESIQEVLSRFNLPPIIQNKAKAQEENSGENKENTNNAVQVEEPPKIYIEELASEEQLIGEQRKREMEKSILGDIPADRPVVFISYSWDSEEHKNWVAKLAGGLANAGIYVLLDQYLEDGTLLPYFMDRGIERADKVLVVGTTTYKEKSHAQTSGVAFEDCIIRSHIFQNLGTKKFIPCLRHGTFKDSFPLILNGNKGHNFMEDERFDTELDDLCREIWHKPKLQRPILGNVPDYVNN